MSKLVLATILVVIFTTTVSAQDGTIPTKDYSQKTEYNIAGIKVTGAETRDRNAIKSIANLREGKKIKVPGEEIPKAIRALMRLRLFDNVEIIQEKTEGDLIYLEILLSERPTLSRYSIKGENKNKHSDLTSIINDVINKGSIVTEDVKVLAIQKLEQYYVEEGFLDAEVTIKEVEDKLKDNSVRLQFDIDKKERVKISDIVFLGNRNIPDSKLRRKFKNTKQKARALKKSKYVVEDLKEDKNNVIALYNQQGFRDAKFVSDSIVRRIDGDIQMFLTIDEGERYYFRDITWKGNSKYTDEQLSSVLGINPGDIYNPELLENRLTFSLDGRDVSSLYLDDGYLFFNVDPVEKAVSGTNIDLEMQIAEGAQATIANVGISGNDRTNEHVIRRELRTKPGNKFSRTDIIRSQRSLINLGFFNPETMDIQTPPNQANGTVDVNYTVEETSSDQLELSAGYGGASGLLGTLGVTFNNFSVKNIRNKESWSPLPQGDGQKVSLRAQSGRFFNSFNASFTDPWLGGKKPTSFTIGAAYSEFDQTISNLGKLQIVRTFTGIGTQLKWPDDFFSINTTLNLEFINLDNFGSSFGSSNFVTFDEFDNPVNITDGSFKNFNINTTITRSSVSEPIYPRRGSRISLSIQLTPPYSLFRGSDDFYELTDPERAVIEEDLRRERGPVNPPSEADIQNAFSVEESANKFQFLEYHKWKFNAEWYFNIVGKFVIAANMKFGFLGEYNGGLGIVPFERFELGGDGLSNQNVGINGKEIISLRGYDVTDLAENARGGGAIYDKLTLELRYPLSLNPNSSIYVSGFVQGGNVWSGFDEFNPFEFNRSAGFGARVFLPMFGLLGFDYGWGFDKDPNDIRFDGFGQFSIILGFEPE